MRVNESRNLAPPKVLSSDQTLPRGLVFTGSQVNYFFVCWRKLWLFSHDLDLEADSDLVLLGRLLHETGYARKFKEVSIGRVKIDFLERGSGEIHEVKRSRRMEKAHLFQLLYYIYYLGKFGVNVKGVLHYPLLKRTVNVELTEEKARELETVLEEMKKIIAMAEPPLVERKPICKKCSYYELCWC
jgi:CRISPR-associated exonuclease Cas4